jgi:hypothetical protein
LIDDDTCLKIARQNLKRSANVNPGQHLYPLYDTSNQSNRAFEVNLPDAIINDNPDTIEMEGIYYGTEYTARSFVIRNNESVPLEFYIKSNLKHGSPTELIFSLSRITAKVFRSECRVT